MSKPVETLNAVSTFLGTSLAIVIVGLLTLGGWYGYRTLNNDRIEREQREQEIENHKAKIAALSKDLTARDEQIGELNGEIDVLNEDIAEKEEEIRRLDTAIRLLKVDRRVARVEVLSQTGSAGEGDLATEFSFVEIDGNGKPLEEPRVFSVKGDLIYLDAWVVKFSDELVEVGDPLRAASVCLFRRVFGEAQQPKDGFVLDKDGAQPAAYRSGGDVSDFEREIWTRFWEYANNPETAREAGIRAAHGEAPSIRLQPGKSYKVQLRSSGGLTIVPEDRPPKKGGDAM